jgi:hypothetical protein
MGNGPTGADFVGFFLLEVVSGYPVRVVFSLEVELQLGGQVFGVQGVD